MAAPPTIVSVLVGEGSVTATSARLQASVNPEGIRTTFRFEYLPEAAYEANLGAQPPRGPFAGAAVAPLSGAGLVGAGGSAVPAGESVTGLAPETGYRFRLRVVNSLGEATVGAALPFATEAPTNAFALLDHRGWEMVSPAEKGGGAAQPPGAISGGGVFQAAAGGGGFTYSAADSFGPDAEGAPSGSQYLATRTGAGWATANITTPLLSGSYGSEPDGVPYQLFSGDLGSGLLSNGERCRGQAGGECPVANPPLPGSGAPPGYRDYYRRAAPGTFESILTAVDLSHTSLGPGQFELSLVGASPDLGDLIVSSCAALAAGAVEVGAPGGCDPTAQNLYEWSGGQLSLVNVLPGETTGSPGAAIAARRGAISVEGSRVYFALGGAIYLREGARTKTVLGTPGGEFQGASADGGIAYLVDGGQLDRYSSASESLASLPTGGGVEGVLGISADGSTVYYAESGAIFENRGETVTEVASSADPENWLPASATARVSADGSRLLFLSNADLTGYRRGTEVFLYAAAPGGGPAFLTCISCNPSGELPRGSAAIPGARPNGVRSTAIDVYRPRVLSASGNRAFFETIDSLVPQDTNGQIDVYEWEASGEGTCVRAGGCVQLISSGRDPAPSYFLDADESGTEAFFLTAASLVPQDPGSYDVYDAREFGGFSVPGLPIPCGGDACQVLPSGPEDPTPGTLVSNLGNPPLKVEGKAHSHAHRKKHKQYHHKKTKKKHAKHGRAGR